MRFGLILSGGGGVLRRMLPAFSVGAGGRLADGLMFWSWIAIDDALAAIEHAIATEEVQGPVNVVSPRPVTNREFTETLGKVVHRPTLLPVPRVALELVFGDMAREAMLSSFRVRPTVLQNSGFEFEYPDLDSALRHLLGRPQPT